MADADSKALHRHGQTKTSEYHSWCSMIGRCCNPRNHKYPRYGGRGITVCERWRTSFLAFLEDMGPKPAGRHISIERLDNDNGYSKENCVWAFPKQQARNTQHNVMLTFDGRTQCISAWAEEIGMPMNMLWQRINRLGWTVEQAMTTPRYHRCVSASSVTPSL